MAQHKLPLAGRRDSLPHGQAGEVLYQGLKNSCKKALSLFRFLGFFMSL